MKKKKLIQILKNIARLLEIRGDNPFKTRAYSNAAEILEAQDIDLETLVKTGSLKEVKGFGKALSEKITDFWTSGKMEYYSKLTEEVPLSLLSVTRISNLGPKKTRLLWQQLGITDTDSLEKACLENEVSALKGFSTKTQEMILNSVEHVKASRGLMLQQKALELLDVILAKLNEHPDISRAVLTGDIRRYAETIEHAHILLSIKENPFDFSIIKNALNEDISVSEPEKAYLWEIPMYKEHQNSETPAETELYKFLLDGSFRVFLEIVPKEKFPWILHYSTGSKDYLEAFKDYLSKKNYSPERTKLIHDGNPFSFSSEKELYEKFDLQYTVPEMRELPATLQQAIAQGLPDLVNDSDLRGMLHCHSDWSDGRNTIREMALTSKELGFDYFVICDHSQSAAYAGGLTPDRVVAQHKEIDALNKENLGIEIFKGIESDILTDGSLDYTDEQLRSFDMVVASIHSSFKMTKKEMTRRMIKAIKNPFMHVLGHPTGRLLLARPAYELDIAEVIKAAADYGKIIEINANPYRLDLPWEWLQYAKELGVGIAINPDSHKTDTLKDVFLGVKMARKAGLEKADIVNCLSSQEFFQTLRK